MEVDLPDYIHTQLQNLKYDEKWPVLKPVLEPLFHSNTTPEIASMIKDKYGFDANATQYKYRFKQWGWTKAIPSKKKNQILDIAQSRVILGKRSAATYGGAPVDSKKLKRHANTIARKDLVLPQSSSRSVDGQAQIFGAFLPFGNRLFANWTMPFGTSRLKTTSQTTNSPWYDPAVGTPGSIQVQTPSEHATSPGFAGSPDNAPSPFSAAVVAQASTNRANLFLQGRFTELINSMNKNEKSTMSIWLYQFWFFSFTSAKHWGQDIQPWTAERLEFDKFHHARNDRSPGFGDQSGALAQNSPSAGRVTEELAGPSDLCRWSTHLADKDYQADVDGSDEVNFSDPNEQHQTAALEEVLGTSLATNDFSTIPSGNLPLAVPKIAGAVQQSRELLLEESLAFAIMARNFELVAKLLSKSGSARLDMPNLFPFHIATSYLDGGKTCCTIIRLLLKIIDVRTPIELVYNNHGHTILDNLMLTIMRSHSSATIGVVDASLKQNARFAGIEVDVCGRWDADSPCFRSLAASGVTTIPRKWKHKFCHTSIQAVCHAIYLLPQRMLSPPSGLFLRHCHHCGIKLQLQPLHTLIMTGYELATNCCPDEDLFGIIACFLCLIAEGLSPLSLAPVSVSSLLRQDDDGEDCNHEDLTAYELAEFISESSTALWPIRLRIGWRLLCKTISLATHGCKDMSHEDFQEKDYDEETLGRKMEFERDCDHIMPRDPIFGSNLALGHIWASVQTELLNYRRLREEDPWLSKNFDMSGLLSSLEADAKPAIGYVEQDLMRPYCRCGQWTWNIPRREDVSRHYYSNMDCWHQTSFIRSFDFDLE